MNITLLNISIQTETIVCLTRVWQPLFPLFCDKTFEFAIQTWQTTLEHYYVYKPAGTNLPFVSTPQNVDFAHKFPVVKCAQCRQSDFACLSVANNTNTQDCIVGNGHILQWDLMSKIIILQF